MVSKLKLLERLNSVIKQTVSVTFQLSKLLDHPGCNEGALISILKK